MEAMDDPRGLGDPRGSVLTPSIYFAGALASLPGPVPPVCGDDLAEPIPAWLAPAVVHGGTSTGLHDRHPT